MSATDTAQAAQTDPQNLVQPDSSPESQPEEDHRNRPTSKAFVDFITSQWGSRPDLGVRRAESADYAAERRARLSDQYAGSRLVIPAGGLKVRSNDTDYRFRPHSAFAHLTGMGADVEPDGVLVMHPVFPGQGDITPSGDIAAHHAVLYVRPLAGRDSEEFYADARYGEFWVGARPSLADVETTTGIEARHIDELRDALAKDVGGADGVNLLVVKGSDEAVETMVEAVRLEAGVDAVETSESADAASSSSSDTKKELDPLSDEGLLRATAEIRLVKDPLEIAEMRKAVDETIAGFAEVVRALPRAQHHHKGERVIETVFDARARLEGNDVGYDTIAASGDHATTLHWIRNDGAVRDGDLVLIDAGVEVDSLYTADITRTLPVNGRFTDVQRRVYTAVLDAADAAFAAAVPGAKFTDVHNAAMEVIAARLEEWGLLPGGITAAQSLDEKTGQQHRRWMVHGTSHHLGIDVHDCSQARRDLYQDGILEPGMVFTIEPGLYFKADDLAVPAEYRGIGVRIEDDILITDSGPENLSAALPRHPDSVEAWMGDLLG